MIQLQIWSSLDYYELIRGYATAERTKLKRTWTIAEAKARLSEVLRLAEEEGPQRIYRRNTFVVVPERLWQQQSPLRKPLGQWLVENMPRGIELEIPDRRSNRKIPFTDEEST
ncbi:MAG: type II toxin-antitoxin system Phd/YefM family antitoxin [Nitrospira sp. SB0662_bin_26]|nr:type II toxin-antitoxin system Phd/YefM family antitoxin [Nitrospira sp. SB0662_bin_26]